MSKKTGLILGILATILLGTFLYSKFCCHCADKETTSGIVASTGNGMILKGSSLDYQCEENFNFKENDLQYIAPVDACVDAGIEKLKADFEKNPNQKLLITGYCTSAEKKSVLFPNLGFDRANQVKNYLISKGIPSEKLDINGEVKDLIPKDKTFYGPISYTLSDVNANAPAEDFGKLKEEINASPLILYFETNQSEINLTDEEKQKVAKIVRYIDHVKDAKIAITGHTDNVGNTNKNIQLSKERADFAAKYLGSNGVSAEKITTSGKGPNEPIADNATAEGKAKNRRTVVQIQ